MKIKDISISQMLDSQGVPGFYCLLKLDSGASVTSMVSCVDYQKDLFFLSLQYCHYIFPLIINQSADVVQLDHILCEFAIKYDISNEAIFAISSAICKAQAIVNDYPLYELLAHLCLNESITIPFPLIPVFDQLSFLKSDFPFLKSLMIVPIGESSFKAAIESSLELILCIKKELKKGGLDFHQNENGLLVCEFSKIEQALNIITTAINLCGFVDVFMLALDVSIDAYFDDLSGFYQLKSEFKTAKELIAIYEKWIESFAIYSISNGFSKKDENGLLAFYLKESDNLQIGYDFYCKKVSNTHCINVLNFRTVSELLQTIDFYQNESINLILNCLESRMDDTFIADLSIATSCGQVNFGGFFSLVTISKYNRLMKIEDDLTLSILDSL